MERENRGEGRIGLFWPGKLIVEIKSTGKDLGTEKGGAARQAFDYIDHLDPDERPHWVMVAAGASLADLYDPLTMPAELMNAHQHLDHAVDKAYRATAFLTERERVEFLFARFAPPSPRARNRNVGSNLNRPRPLRSYSTDTRSRKARTIINHWKQG